MSLTEAITDPGALPAQVALLTVPDVSELLGTDVSRVRQLLREHRLLAVRGEDGVLRIPADFVQEGQLLKGLAGALTVLRDNGYGAREALRWLYTPDDTLPGTPVQALVKNRGTEVRRRAQALGF